MVSTYTTLLRLDKQGTGDNTDTWGAALNTNVFDMIDEAIAGYEEIAFTSSDVTLTENNGATDQARKAILKATGTLSASVNMIVPTTTKRYAVWNACTVGANTLTVKTAGGTGIIIPQDAKRDLFCDGTNVEELYDDLPSDALSNVVEDLTPQLGGALDLNGKVITDASSGSTITVWTAPVTATSDVNRLKIDTSATGVVPRLLASGSDTDIDLGFGGKGTGRVVAGLNTDAPFLYAGRNTIWVPAQAMRPKVTGGAAIITAAASDSNSPDLTYLAFDKDADEAVQFGIQMPRAWDRTGLTFRIHWSHPAATAFGVAFALQGVQVRNNNAFTANNFGTAIVVTDTGASTGTNYVSAESTDITVGNAPTTDAETEGGVIYFNLFRDVSDAGDTLDVDAFLHGISVYYISDDPNDND